MNILVSNDDGVYAPGIVALAKALSTIATVTVVAPDRNRSGASNALTLSRPLRVRQLDNGFYSVDGTPTDCVHLALTGLLETSFDMVVSGINHGANLGDDILYSGTVAAAIEGRSLGLPAVAVSLVGHTEMDFDAAAHKVSVLVASLVQHRLPAGVILNVNIPDCPYNKLSGVEVTRLGARHKAAPMVQELDPRGLPIYWVGPAGSEADAGVGTDFDAVNRDCISMTPLHVDLTHYKIFDQVSQWVETTDWSV
jgi:5'-nucleotidase